MPPASALTLLLHHRGDLGVGLAMQWDVGAENQKLCRSSYKAASICPVMHPMQRATQFDEKLHKKFHVGRCACEASHLAKRRRLWSLLIALS